jgi:hypothetical protein
VADRNAATENGFPSGTGTVGRDAALRASWGPTIVMAAPMRMSSSGSAGKLAAVGG